MKNQWRWLVPLLIAYANICGAQAVTGTVEDVHTGEGLIGAYVIDASGDISTATDEFGNFRIKSKSQDSTLFLSFSYLGYRPLDTLITSFAQPLRIRLAPNAELPTVEVKMTNPERDRRNTLRIIDLPVQLLNAIPPLAGEVDPLKALQLMPGVSAGAEGTADLFVRGGTPDQNLILFDGAKVYNANHLFGFLSPFHPDLLKHIRIHKAGFPTRFGGRLSSVVEVEAKEGNKSKWTNTVGLGLINSRFSLDGPLHKDKVSLIIGGRTAHLSLLNLVTRNQENYQTYLFYDLNVKANYKSDRSNLSLSFFRNHDRSVVEDRFLRTPLRGTFTYGNLTSSARWAYAISPAFSSVVLLTTNTYQFRAQEELQDDTTTDRITSKSTIAERTVRVELRGDLSTALSINIGMEGNDRTVSPRQLTTNLPAFPVISGAVEYSKDLALYQSTKVSFNKRILVEGGVRLQNYQLPESRSWISFVEPRLNVEWRLPEETTISASYAKMSQGLHMISNNFIGIPTNLWVTANNFAPPSSTHHVATGLSFQVNPWTQVTVDGYFKSGRNIIDPLPGTSFFQSGTDRWEDDVSTGGRAEAYGVELLYRRSSRPLFGWIGYTLSWNRIRYDNINQGEFYYRQFDRRHDLSVVGGLNLPNKWQFLTTFAINSGFRLTLPAAIHYDGFSRQALPLYLGRYGERSPIYHRLDVSFRRQVTRPSGGVRVFTIGCNNVYGRRNPTYILTETDVSSNPSILFPSLPATMSNSARQFSLFTFIPFLSYRFSL